MISYRVISWCQTLLSNSTRTATARGDAGRVAGVFYFVSFYVATVLILVNILTSLVMAGLCKLNPVEPFA